jgi:hypothetical protein
MLTNPKEKKQTLPKKPFDGDLVKQITGIDTFLLNASDEEAVYRNYFEPMCNICSIHAGYIEEGLKIIVPSTVIANREDFSDASDIDIVVIAEGFPVHPV